MVYFCMSTESLNKISSSEINESQNPIRKVELPPRRANMDVLKKRLLLEKKKEKKKNDNNCFYTCSFSRCFNGFNLLNF